MSEIIRITADRIVKKAKNKTKFYADDGSIVEQPSKQVRVFDSQEELEQDASQAQAEYDAMMARGPDDEPTETEQVGDTDAPAAAPARSTKRGKGKGKEQMATKKAAKKGGAKAKSAVKKTSDGSTIRMVAGREHDISGYEKSKSASGNTSYDNGDDVAASLRGKDLDYVYGFASKKLKEPEADLRKKYKHLNPGMQRMSLGNRLRKALSAKAAA